MSEQRHNLLNYNHKQLRDWCVAMGEKPFRGTQLFRWIHHYGVADFASMTDLSKAFRERLPEIAEITLPEIALEQKSNDGTVKWLLRLADGNCIETVYIPEVERGTLCISSQVGCALNCTFCSTARQGFSRNLTTAEIIGQLWVAARQLSKNNGQHDRHVSNVVMMGMGEPLLNFDNVVSAMDMMMDDHGYGLSKYRVTLSTSGVVPEMYALAKTSDVALAVSLHAPNDELRNQLVPLNKKYPLAVLMKACREYFPKDSRRKITMEYVMLAGVNDSLAHAKQLAKLLEGVPAKVNLIPFNPFPYTQYKRSSQEVIDKFRYWLINAGVNTVTRKTRGEDIDAACGQLAGEVKDRTRRSERMKKAYKRLYSGEEAA